MKIADCWRGCYVLLVTSTGIFITYICNTCIHIYTHTRARVCVYVGGYMGYDMNDKNTDVIFFSNVMLVRLSH